MCDRLDMMQKEESSLSKVLTKGYLCGSRAKCMQAKQRLNPMVENKYMNLGSEAFSEESLHPSQAKINKIQNEHYLTTMYNDGVA